ncbi:hypothetical protein [Carboxylicivirga sp. N1Y90]|uniref:DUF7935 family protein n=1 Tax=Carboxylicivirga fragile TaxID=3417571 RepID=UPI003D358B68|nr:hypothetical protein [Marinilabiliaceae bacterium N1Y90]
MLNLNELIQSSLPFFLFAIPLLILVRCFLKHNLKLKQIELASSLKKELIPNKIQAYERVTLLLERIHPETLILREQQAGLSNMQLHKQLLKSIRTEFDHNIAMQIYMPSKTWEYVTKARDEVSKLINTCSSQVQPNNPSMELAHKILEKTINETNYYITKAKEKLNNDIELMYL